MEFLAILLLPTLLIIGSLAAWRASTVTLAGLFLIATSCLPGEFFSIQLAGLSWTSDRLILLATLLGFVLAWKRGNTQILPLDVVDYLAILFFLWLLARTLTQPWGSVAPEQPHTLMHLINGYGVPLLIYALIRSTKINYQQLKPIFWIALLTGIYLSLTAVFEVTKVWSLVFPKFIADPTLGIHFGRARGPMLQSVRLGICLLVCLAMVMVFTVWRNPLKRSHLLLGTLTVPLFLLALLLTYTRSIWMGLISVAGLLVLMCLQGMPRRVLVVGGLMAGVVGGIVLGPHLVAFKREYSAAETRESTYMRAAFAYVSLEMIKQRPVAGYGFNQFNIANREFLSDRSTDIRVESIRGYVHHNSYLSLIVDLGIVGFTLYALLIFAWLRESLRVWKSDRLPDWARGFGLLAICVASVHLIQMAFHEVSFSSIENGIFYFCFAIVVSIGRHQNSQYKPAVRWRHG